jgi:iron complex outermembrane receptor protein
MNTTNGIIGSAGAMRTSAFGRTLGLALLSASSVLALGTAVKAQEAGAVEEIVVTGSRIVRDGYQAPTPVTVVATEQLARTAPGSIPDGLNQLPQFASSNGTQNTGNQATRPNSGNYLNLRGLGAIRNLVLLDGQRVPPTSFDGTVDSNVIPQALVQRVDIVTGGASAAYGSDAVSGVINYILDTNYTGIKGTIQKGISGRRDDESFRASIAMGGNFLNDRLHVLFSAEHYDREGIPQNEDRKRGDLKITRVGAGTVANPYRDVGDVRYGNGTFGTLILGSNTGNPYRNFKFGPGGTLIRFDPGIASGTNNYNIGGNGDVSFGKTLTGSQDTDQFFTRFDYEVSANLRAFAQLSFVESANEFTTILSGTQLGDHRIFTSSPFLPTIVKTAMESAGLTSFVGGRLQADQPPKEVKTLNNVYTFLSGLTGSFGDYKWKATYGYGDTLVRSRHYGNFDNQRYYAGLDAVRNAAGEIVCNITITHPGVLDGCVPFNTIGQGSPTKAAYDYISQVSQYQVRQTMHNVAAEVSGELLSLPAGAVAFAAGAEARWQELDQTSNSDPTVPVSLVGLRTNVSTYLNKYNSTNVGQSSGKYIVKEVFGEVAVPLLRDAPMAYSLELNGAARYTDYSTSGGVTTWKVGVSYSPIEELRFRYTRSRDIRAPTLYELFAGDQAARGGFNDIHTATNTNTITLSNGNPDLQPEIGDTYTVGVVWQPLWLAGFSASVDYYDIQISDAIANISATRSNEECELSNGTSVLCQYIIRPFPFSNRTPANFPSAVRTVPFNQALTYQHGIDYEASYRLPLDRFFDGSEARIDMRILGNYAPSKKSKTDINAAPTQNANIDANPKHRVNLQANYVNGPLTVSTQVRYIGAMHRTRNPTIIYVNNDVRSTTYVDLTVDYRFQAYGGDMTAFVSANNLFNEIAPLIGNGQPSQQYPTNQALYDVVGTYITAGLRYSF